MYHSLDWMDKWVRNFGRSISRLHCFHDGSGHDSQDWNGHKLVFVLVGARSYFLIIARFATTTNIISINTSWSRQWPTLQLPTKPWASRQMTLAESRREFKKEGLLGLVPADILKLTPSYIDAYDQCLLGSGCNCIHEIADAEPDK